MWGLSRRDVRVSDVRTVNKRKNSSSGGALGVLWSMVV